MLVNNQKGYIDQSGDYAKQNVAKANSLLDQRRQRSRVRTASTPSTARS